MSFPCPNEKYPCSYTCMRRSGVFGRWREGGRSSSPWPKSKQPKHCLETGTCEVSKDVKSPGSIQTNILVRASIERTKNKSTRNSLILTMQGKPVGNRWQRSLLPWQPSAKQWKTILWSLFSSRLTCFSHNWCHFEWTGGPLSIVILSLAIRMLCFQLPPTPLFPTSIFLYLILHHAVRLQQEQTHPDITHNAAKIIKPLEPPPAPNQSTHQSMWNLWWWMYRVKLLVCACDVYRLPRTNKHVVSYQSTRTNRKPDWWKIDFLSATWLYGIYGQLFYIYYAPSSSNPVCTTILFTQARNMMFIFN